MFQVLILNSRPQVHDPVIFEGNSTSVFLPGAEGEFEILDFHKPIISKLKKGVIMVDNQREIPIQSGVVKMKFQKLIALVEV